MINEHYMAKGRMVHHKIWDSDQFNLLKISYRLLYIGLITIADDYGCFRMDGKFIKRKIFHNDRISPRQIENMIQKLHEMNLIECLDTDYGAMGFHPKWNKYQKLNNRIPKISNFPEILSNINPLPWMQDEIESEVKLNQEKESENNINKVNPLSGREQAMIAKRKAIEESRIGGNHL